MPPTPAELNQIVNGLVTHEIRPDDVETIIWSDGSAITDREIRDVVALFVYALQLRQSKHLKGQRKAMRLLRSLLSAEQRRQLRRSRYFYATTASGVVFRFIPRRGLTERVILHGKRFYAASHFCLHDPEDDDQMPPADLTVAHLLLITTDEPRFLEMANEHAVLSHLWNGDYLRRVRRRRAERESPTGAAS